MQKKAYFLCCTREAGNCGIMHTFQEQKQEETKRGDLHLTWPCVSGRHGRGSTPGISTLCTGTYTVDQAGLKAPSHLHRNSSIHGPPSYNTHLTSRNTLLTHKYGSFLVKK